MQLIILRGLPGCGKSTYQREHYQEAVVASADFFFTKDEEYLFDPKKLGAAHQECFQTCLNALQERAPFVVVDNTNLLAVDIAPYVLLGETFGYEVKILTLVADPKECKERNVHNVPYDTICAMHSKMLRENLPRRWNNRNVYKY